MNWVKSMTMAGSAAATVVGVLVIFNGLYKMADAKSHNRPGDDSEWWTLAKGGLLVAFGASTLLAQLLESIKF